MHPLRMLVLCLLVVILSNSAARCTYSLALGVARYRHWHPFKSFAFDV